jgi:microsomal epoxide hydrolase
MPFSTANIPIRPFTISHTQQEIDDLKTLLRLSPLSVDTYENRSDHAHTYGPSKAWMQDLISSWKEFDWNTAQTKLNEYPQFIASVPDTCPKTGKKENFDVHFVGIENKDPKAVPVVILHGWPGNFYEILPLVPYLTKSSNPPVHLIIPR